MQSLEIHSSEIFPTLSRAPVIEAVLELQGRASVPWVEESITAELKQRLPEYPTIDTVRGLTTEMRFEPGLSPASRSKDLGWMGLVMRQEDKKAVVQFERDTFVFSRLAPIQDGMGSSRKNCD